MLMLGQVKRNSNNSAINGAMESLDDELSNRLIEITRRINPLGSDGTAYSAYRGIFASRD